MSTTTRTSLLLLALVVGVWLRLAGVGEAALFGDEYHTVGVGESDYGTILSTFDEVGSHVVTPLVQKLSLEIFGSGVVPFRLIGLVPGLLTLLLLYPAARSLLGERGETPALVATWLFAVDPMHVYYSRFGRAYALIVLLGLLLAWLVVRVQRGGTGKGTWAGVLLVAAALPVTHLSSVGLVAALGLAALWLAWRSGGAAAVRVPALVFAGAALVAFLCFVPVLGQVQDFFARTQDVKDRPSTWFGVPLLLGGDAPGGVLWLAGFPVAFLFLLRERRAAALVAAAALLGPLAVLLATRPHGMEYAWARYLLAASPFVPILLGWGLVRLVRRAAGERGEAIAAALGVVVALAMLFTGPLRATRPESGAIDNTYLALRALPAFDAVWPDASPFYAELESLEGDLRIVESPPPVSRAVLLFRSHALRHGKHVQLGSLGPMPATVSGPGPYVDVTSTTSLTEAGVDFVILHRNMPNEVRRYWRHVYDDVWSGMRHGLDAGFMKRHQASFVGSQPYLQPEFVAARAALLRDELGPAYYKDDDVLVWKLAP